MNWFRYLSCGENASKSHNFAGSHVLVWLLSGIQMVKVANRNYSDLVLFRAARNEKKWRYYCDILQTISTQDQSKDKMEQN